MVYGLIRFLKDYGITIVILNAKCLLITVDFNRTGSSAIAEGPRDACYVN